MEDSAGLGPGCWRWHQEMVKEDSLEMRLRWVTEAFSTEWELGRSKDWLKCGSSHQPDLSTGRLFLEYSTKGRKFSCWEKKRIPPGNLYGEETTSSSPNCPPPSPHATPMPAPSILDQVQHCPPQSHSHCGRLEPSLPVYLKMLHMCSVPSLLVKYFQLLQRTWSWVWTNLRHFALSFFPIILNLNVFYEKFNPYVSD